MNSLDILSSESYSLRSKNYRSYFSIEKTPHSIKSFDQFINREKKLAAKTSTTCASHRDASETIQFPDSPKPDDIEEPFAPPEPTDVPVPDNAQPPIHSPDL